MTENKQKKPNRNDSAKNRNSGDLVPIPVNTIGTRLSECAKRFGGVKQLAEAIGVSESQLHRYIKGDSEVKVSAVIRAADAAGVTVQWLATGEGEKWADPHIDGGRSGESRFEAIKKEGESLKEVRSALVRAARESGYKPDIQDARELGSLRHILETLMYAHGVPYKPIVQLLEEISKGHETL